MKKSGQTLVLLLVFMAIMITITSAATVITLVNSTTVSKLDQGEMTLDVAESGAENALIRLLRDPSYRGENLVMAAGTAAISVSTSGNNYTITSVGTRGNYQSTVTVNSSYNNYVLTVSSWKQTF